MTHLASLNHVAMSYGNNRLFDDVSLHVHEGDRIGIIGANGVGKSTLLRLLAGYEEPDGGTVARKKNLRLCVVPQVPVFAPDLTVEQVLLMRPPLTGAEVQDSPHERELRAAVALNRLGFTNPQQKISQLSGGWLKRVALALALADEPELLLLDEPTNHLDIEGVLWLEQWLRSSRMACVTISHDRAFLENACTRIVELNRSYPEGLLSCDGGYSRFLEYREEFRENQSRQLESFENRVRNEIEWLKRGAKARSTKAQHRVNTAQQMIADLADMHSRNRRTSTDIDFSASGRRTKRLIVAEGLSKSMGGRLLFENLDLLLKPGICLGLVGGNGSGKTTLLKILLGKLAPDSGVVTQAENLSVAYFDQHRAVLDPDESLARSLCPDGDTVIFRERQIHVAGWARRFGFDTRQLETPVGKLSGGEQARIHIARLMLVPADVLLLDEPTNDLDLPTLEILEQNLKDFPGAVILVTHDRYMLDQLSDLMLGLDGKGGHALVADYSQWIEHLNADRRTSQQNTSVKRTGTATEERKAQRRLTYMEKREYATLEERIMEAEAAAEEAAKRLEDEAVATDPQRVQE